MTYILKIINKETDHDFKMEIEDLRALKEILASFDETKIDVDLHYVEDAKVLKKEK
mgnify:CR=1 FL=1